MWGMVVYFYCCAYIIFCHVPQPNQWFVWIPLFITCNNGHIIVTFILLNNIYFSRPVYCTYCIVFFIVFVFKLYEYSKEYTLYHRLSMHINWSLFWFLHDRMYRTCVYGTIPILLGFMSFSGNVPYNKMPHVKSQARLNFNYSVLVLYTLPNGGRGFWPNRGRLACFPALLHWGSK